MKFHSDSIEEHNEAPLADDGALDQLIARWTAKSGESGPAKPGLGEPNHAWVVAVGDWEAYEERSAEAQLAELVALVGAQGDAIVGYELCRRAKPDPRTYLGSGTAAAIAERARAAGADMLVIDAELSPSQTRNLEDVTGFSVCDREAVILNVFLRHAKTRTARIQVEIAQLEYLRPRIRGIGLDMDQQAGGLMTARGPGETASELLARRIDGRLAELRRQVARLERAGQRQREGRASCGRVALVGYTNAGKTSLMNALTQAELSARDMPFETLDTTTRSLTRHGGDVIISDTVGFIRRLPQRLLASFETTLAEIREASVVCVVVDLSDPEWDMHLDTTHALLERLGAGALARVYVFNKLDKLAPAERPRPAVLEACAQGHAHWALSAHDEDAVASVRAALIDAARPHHRRARVRLPYAASEAISAVYAHCRLLSSEAIAEGLVVDIDGPAHHVAAIVAAGQVLEG
ncbi:GTP-binding protein [Plesiocystis pacifica SIR-1]|uniref:GTPase HflX n=1 Tax=Plesiocystis pacifica SIR-1 TaxID=391625 RepID=A6FWT5_9BACT|nr:GTPase HflX [Plesiocystis pacifica]EDM81759.1 GTP-binding protein [Plesiocystis pacifica SIR-1]